MTDDDGRVDVTVSATALGTYVAVIAYSDDEVLSLTRTETLEYAYTLHTAIAWAEYDAAVLRQHRSKNIPDRMTVPIVRGMRADRPELRPFNPYQFRPAVNMDGCPSVQVWAGPAFILDIDPAGVREHVQQAIEAHTIADLDNAYLRYLRRSTIDDEIAREVVADLRRHRTT